MTEPGYTPETVSIGDLRPHPRNYRSHPREQVDHLIQSIREHGLYRNVVVARDGTILAGHGIVEAATELGIAELPVIRVPLDPDDPKALKILTGDNELGNFADTDDRLLSELLKEIGELDVDGLLGTGYDEQMLAGLLYVTRSAAELVSFDATEHWRGLPEFREGEEKTLKIIVHCETEADRAAFMERLGATVIQKQTRGTWSIFWPERAKEDLSSLRFDVADPPR